MVFSKKKKSTEKMKKQNTKKNKNKWQKQIGSSSRIISYSFGSPRWANSVMASYYATIVDINWRVVNKVILIYFKIVVCLKFMCLSVYICCVNTHKLFIFVFEKKKFYCFSMTLFLHYPSKIWDITHGLK